LSLSLPAQLSGAAGQRVGCIEAGTADPEAYAHGVDIERKHRTFLDRSGRQGRGGAGHCARRRPDARAGLHIVVEPLASPNRMLNAMPYANGAGGLWNSRFENVELPHMRLQPDSVTKSQNLVIYSSKRLHNNCLTRCSGCQRLVEILPNVDYICSLVL